MTGMSDKYVFYGWQEATVPAVNKIYEGIETPQDLYDVLSNVWCVETCATRMRHKWSPDNKTLGQCSITSFLVQDIFGGKVYGVPLKDGTFHCFNEVNGHIFDLTSEQFKGEKLEYTLNYEQSREAHFSKGDKYERYLLLTKKLRLLKNY